MLDRPQLLSDLQRLLTKLEDDLRRRTDADPALKAKLTAQHAAAKTAGRTASAYAVWRDELVTQVGVAWLLGCVFVRFLEDNGFLDTPLLSGPGERLARARDQHEAYFRAHPVHSDRDYLEHVFRSLRSLPTLEALLGERHNALWQFSPSGDMAGEILRFFQQVEPDTGALVRDFTDTTADTRFLGDLYQDLSEAARKRYALLQTPRFIEEFILDRTLTPALDVFGLETVRLLDPTCGSGHFVLGGFGRILELWRRREPGTPVRELVQRALDAVYGVDLNPFAVAIARFRLLIAALRACEIQQLRFAPDFRLNLAVGDSLLHGRRFRRNEGDNVSQRTFDTEEVFRDELKHHYEVEDIEALHRILGQQYHAVVGNPPYIAVSDAAVSELYRARFPSCYREYSLSVPFMERFFDLAVKGDGTPPQPAGFVGQITAKSFMKRKFGKKLIEELLPLWDLTHVLDTAGAYIPGHGTPTVILFGKNQPPVIGTIRTVLGIRGEPSTPTDPAKGLVWDAIVSGVDNPGSQSEYVSVSDTPRSRFQKHPWSIGGGGASDLKATLDSAATTTLESMSCTIGYSGQTNADDALVADALVFRRLKLEDEFYLPFVIGDLVRDFEIGAADTAIFPYRSGRLMSLALMPHINRYVWPSKTVLGGRKTFSKQSYFQEGRAWWAWHQIALDRLTPPEALVFAFVATHNHFVFNNSLKVFNRSAPFIKLKTEYQADAYLAIAAVLNSSSACFWMKQVCHCTGSTVDDQGARQTTVPFEDFYQFTGTDMASFPIPARQPRHLAIAIFKSITALQGQSPAAALARWGGSESGDLRPCLSSARDLATHHRRQLIAWQEELDWQIYEAFGLVEGADGVSLPEGKGVNSDQYSVISEDGRSGTDHGSLITDDLPPLEHGQRAFEIMLARRMAAGEAQSTWFERHGSKPITEVPRHWPAPYRELVERRIARIEGDPNIRLIEQPEYKRRWNTEPWDEQQERALREWMLVSLEGYFHGAERMCSRRGDEADGPDPLATLRGSWPAGRQPALVTTHRLADCARADAAFLQVAELYRGRPDFDLAVLVAELVADAAVPALPVQRYKETGLRNRLVWEEVWDLQRKEDDIDLAERVDEPGLPDLERARRKAFAAARKKAEIGDIPVPPKYASKDFKSGTHWGLRGKLDVPKERWVSYPGAERGPDTSLVIAWAGWDPLQQAKAVTAYLEDLKSAGGSDAKQFVLLAALAQLIPWLLQWHNEVDAEFGERLGDYFRNHLADELRRLGKTDADLRAVGYGSHAFKSSF